MDYQQAVNRLWNHSNLPHSYSSENESLLFYLYQSEKDNQSPTIEPLLDDVIHCLDTINLEFNGPEPSKTFGRINHAVLEQVSYPISGIISGMLNYYRRWQKNDLFSLTIRDSLLEGVIKIAYAWDQVLAGDIDDLLEGLEII